MALAKKFTASAAFLLVLLAAGLQAQPAYAEDDMTATFTYPVDKGLSFYDNIDVVVRYECSVDAVDLRIYCNNADTKEIDEVTMVEDVKCSDGQYKLRIDFGYEADECRFNMRDTDGSGDIEVNSVAFSLSANGPAETTFGLKEPTSSFAETTTEPTSTAPPATTTTTTTDIEPTETKSSGDDGLSTGAKAGIGVGVGLGVVGIAALAGALWLVRRKKGGGGDDASPVERQELYGESAEAKPTYFVQTNQAPKPDEAPPSELMDSRHTRHELTG